MYPREGLGVAWGVRPNDLPVVLEATLLDLRVALEPVAVNTTPWPHALREGLANVLLTHVRQDGHACESGLSVAVLADDQDRSLRRPPPSLAPTMLPSVVALVDFDRSAKIVRPVPLQHGVADLVGHEPRGLVAADAKKALGFQGRAAFLVGRDQEEHPKPQVQGPPCSC